MPAGIAGHYPGGTPLVFDDDAFVAQRGDHLGLSVRMRRLTLEWLLPQGTQLYAGLFTEMPDRAGSGGTEASVTGYARVPISRWVTKVEGASVRRNNAVPILWPDLEQPLVVVGWGLWEAATGGVADRFDWTRTSGPTRQPVAWTVPVGDRFGIASGVNGIGLVL